MRRHFSVRVDLLPRTTLVKTWLVLMLEPAAWEGDVPYRIVRALQALIDDPSPEWVCRRASVTYPVLTVEELVQWLQVGKRLPGIGAQSRRILLAVLDPWVSSGGKPRPPA